MHSRGYFISYCLLAMTSRKERLKCPLEDTSPLSFCCLQSGFSWTQLYWAPSCGIFKKGEVGSSKHLSCFSFIKKYQLRLYCTNIHGSSLWFFSSQSSVHHKLTKIYNSSASSCPSLVLNNIKCNELQMKTHITISEL